MARERIIDGYFTNKEWRSQSDFVRTAKDACGCTCDESDELLISNLKIAYLHESKRVWLKMNCCDKAWEVGPTIPKKGVNLRSCENCKHWKTSSEANGSASCTFHKNWAFLRLPTCKHYEEKKQKDMEKHDKPQTCADCEYWD